MAIRRKFTPQFKAEIVIEVLTVKVPKRNFVGA